MEFHLRPVYATHRIFEIDYGAFELFILLLAEGGAQRFYNRQFFLQGRYKNSIYVNSEEMA